MFYQLHTGRFRKIVHQSNRHCSPDINRVHLKSSENNPDYMHDPYVKGNYYARLFLVTRMI